MLRCMLLPWSGGSVKHGMLQTWLACFLLAATVTGGEDLTATGDNCKEEAGLQTSMLFTNLVFTRTKEFGPQWHLSLS